MIKKFENFVNEARMKGNNKDIMFEVRRLLSDIRHELDDRHFYLYKHLGDAFKHEDIEKVITILADLRVAIGGAYQYESIAKKIDDILDKVNFDDVDADYPTTNKGKIVKDVINDRMVAHSKFGFMKEVAREYFDKKAKELSYEVTDEDGKVSVGTKRDDFYKNNEELKKIRRVLGTTLDLDYRTCEMIEDRLIKLSKERGFHYTSKELKEIFTKLDENDIRRFVKEFIDLNNIYKDKGIERMWEFIRKNHYPFAVAPNGKILTGDVFYNPVLDIFAKTKDEMEYLIDIFKKSNIYEKITDYFENLPDVSKYESVYLRNLRKNE